MVKRMNTGFSERKKASGKLCFICNTKKAKISYGDFCSSDCAKIFADYNMISLPLPFIKRVFFHCVSEEDKLNQLRAFAKRHGYVESLVIKKANKIYKDNFNK